MARLDGMVDQARRGRKLDRRLGDIVARIGPERGGEFGLLRLRGVWANQHAISAGRADGLDHELIQVGQDVTQLRRLAAKVGLDIR